MRWHRRTRRQTLPQSNQATPSHRIRARRGYRRGCAAAHAARHSWGVQWRVRSPAHHQLRPRRRPPPCPRCWARQALPRGQKGSLSRKSGRTAQAPVAHRRSRLRRRPLGHLLATWHSHRHLPPSRYVAWLVEWKAHEKQEMSPPKNRRASAAPRPSTAAHQSWCPGRAPGVHPRHHHGRSAGVSSKAACHPPLRGSLRRHLRLRSQHSACLTRAARPQRKLPLAPRPSSPPRPARCLSPAGVRHHPPLPPRPPLAPRQHRLAPPSQRPHQPPGLLSPPALWQLRWRPHPQSSRRPPRRHRERHQPPRRSRHRHQHPLRPRPLLRYPRPARPRLQLEAAWWRQRRW